MPFQSSNHLHYFASIGRSRTGYFPITLWYCWLAHNSDMNTVTKRHSNTLLWSELETACAEWQKPHLAKSDLCLAKWILHQLLTTFVIARNTWVLVSPSTSVIAWSVCVCLSVGHDREHCKKWLNRLRCLLGWGVGGPREEAVLGGAWVSEWAIS